jgi:hypothetical protein
MKKAHYLLFFSLFILFKQSPAQGVSSLVLGKNIIKFNLSSVAIEHYMLQYERALALNKSIGLGIGFSSGIEIPFKGTLLNQFGGNEDARRAIETTKFDKLTITPEYRFYFGPKGAPLGFYLATFVRYTKLSFTQDYTFTPGNGIEHVAAVTGKLNGVGGGAMMGIQWALGNSLTLDWWILGPFVGVQDGHFDGICDMSDMSPEDYSNLESDIESIDIPLWTIDATVYGNVIDAKISGPFYGVRMLGLSLGFRF